VTKRTWWPMWMWGALTLCLLLGAGAQACGDDGDPTPADADASGDTIDATSPPEDTTPSPDTAEPGDTVEPGDTSTPDTGPSDTTEPADTGPSDTGPSDTSAPADTGPTDTSAPPDTSEPDPVIVYDPIPGQWSEDFSFSLPGLQGGQGPRAYAMVEAGGGVYVGGSFERVGDLPAANIARWVGGEGWAALGDGLAETVHALAVDDAGGLYAAGRGPSGGFISSPGAISRWDGAAWETLGWTGSFEPVRVLAWLDGDLIVGGEFDSVELADQSDAVHAPYLARWDGTAWHAFDDAPNGPVYAITLHGDGFCVGGSFDAVGAVAARNVACHGEAGWSALGDGLNSQVNALTSTSDGLLHAGGYFDFGDPLEPDFRVGLARYDGGVWHPLAGGVLGGGITNVWVIREGPSGELYIGGNFQGVDAAQPLLANHFARLDGETWTTFAGGVTNQLGVVLPSEVGVRAVALDGARVIAGGLFSRAGEASALNIARFDQVAGTWSALVTLAGRYLGVAGGINSVSIDDDGAVTVGGYFDSAGGATTPNVARLRGIAWEPLGEGLDDTVWVVHAARDGSIYAGGIFSGLFKRFDGAAWQPVGAGLDGDVRAIHEEDDGTIIIGGSFVLTSGVATNHIAAWDGAYYTPFASGVNDRVNAVTRGPDGALYIGGFFTATADHDPDTGAGHALNRVARWDGVNWEDLGGGLDGYVTNLAVWDGRLIVIGQFREAGGVTVSSIAAWDGSAWEPIGDPDLFLYSWGSPQPLSGIATQANGFFVAGNFWDTEIDTGELLNFIAWWDGERFHPLDLGTDDIVEDMAVSRDGRALFVGGGFTAAGATDALGLARWDYDDEEGTVVDP